MPDGYDALIIGGGPAGSTLAGLLAQRGRRALVIERQTFPRFHIGESLLPRSCEVFAKLGLKERVDERFIRKYGATFICANTDRTNTYLFAEALDDAYPYAYQVPRAEFDSLLLDRAVELGAEVKQPYRVTDVLFEGDRAVGVRCEGDEGELELRAPVVVDSSGRGSLLATRFGSKRRLTGLDTTAMFGHYTDVPRGAGDVEGHIRIVVFDHGWFWFIPFRGNVTSVGVVAKREWMNRRNGQTIGDFFAHTVASVAPVRDSLADATLQGAVQATADFSYDVQQLVGDGWLCVGDACGFIDPLFSTGAHLAIKGADLAAEAIDVALASGDNSRDAYSDYERRVKDASSLFLGVVQAFYRGEFREMLFTQEQRRSVRKIITSMLSGDVVHNGTAPTWARWIRSRYPAGYE